MPNESLVKAIITITRELTGLIQQQNEILQNRRPADLGALESQRDRLIRDYEAMTGQLKSDPQALGALAGEERRELSDVTRQFHDKLNVHRRLVQSAKIVTERMVDAVVKEVSKRTAPVASYGPANAYGGGMPARRPISLSCDTVI